MSEPNTEIVIETRQLTKIYPPQKSFFEMFRDLPGKLAVDAVDLNVGRGEIFGLVGSNGAGKTTLIRMLCSMLTPTSGEAMVGGLDIVRDERQVRRSLGLVASNERSFFWRLTGRQNIRFFADLYHVESCQLGDWLEEIIDALDLRHIIDMRFDHYSTGQKQRLAIARGLLDKPGILLMDEPTKGVDPIGSIKLVKLIRERIANLWHPTILVTSHNLSEIEKLCDRTALMDRGRIIAIGRHDELRAMVGALDHYQMKIEGAGRERIVQLAKEAGAASHEPFNDPETHYNWEIAFPQNEGGMARFVNGLVREEAQLERCMLIETELDDVFHSLIQRNRAEEKPQGGKAA